MSKGLGRAERYVIDHLALHGAASVAMILPFLAMDGPGFSEPSLRRAIGSLQRKGLIAPAQLYGRPIFWELAAEAKKQEQRKKRADQRKWRAERERRRREALMERIRGKGRQAHPEAHTSARILDVA